MLQRKVCASFAVILALVATPVLAQQQQHDEHHPGTAPPAARAAPGPGMPGGIDVGRRRHADDGHDADDDGRTAWAACR